MSVITRFAPSPTGLLHIGNIRTALICYLFAKHNNGKFMLRLDDTDIERSTTAFADSILEDLKWVGINWDIFAKQSERLTRYKEIVEQLIKIGRLYPCYETAEEIEIKRKMLLNRGKPPIYDRAALKLTKDEIEQLDKSGKEKHWRFKLNDNEVIKWHDLIKGEISFKSENLSDPVLIRANGSPTYMLPSVIDDIDYNITNVIRGEDHVSNTAVQIQIFAALGAKIPEFAHHSLMKTTEGKISKRKGGYSICTMREEHIEPMAICSLMSKLGSSEPVVAVTDMQKLGQEFNLKSFGKAAAIYDHEDLKKLNSKIIHSFTYAEIKHREELKNITEDFWAAVKDNINQLNEIQTWYKICKENITPIMDDLEYTKQAALLLPNEPWDYNTWNLWIDAIKAKTNRKGKELFMPLRKALTAEEHGPELKFILPLIGRDRALSRLNGNIS